MITNLFPKIQERRYAVLIVPQSAMFELLTQTINLRDTFIALRPANIPKTAKVINTFQVPERSAFAFVLEDESFREVPEGMLYPEIAFNFEQVKVTPLRAANEPFLPTDTPHPPYNEKGLCEGCSTPGIKVWLGRRQKGDLLTALCARCITGTSTELV